MLSKIHHVGVVVRDLEQAYGFWRDVLGLPVRKVIIPVASGRNLAVLTEAAVRNTILHLRGVDTMRDFLLRQQQQMGGE